jgi:hypothetical protein
LTTPKKPLFSSPCASSYITVVKPSPTRPAVFFVGKADGGIDIWDLLDKSHLPALSQVVCSSAITSMDFFSSKNTADGSKFYLKYFRNLSKQFCSFWRLEIIKEDYIF